MITALSETSFVVSWVDENTSHDIKAQVFSTAGGGTPTKIGDEFNVATQTAGEEFAPVITALSEELCGLMDLRWRQWRHQSSGVLDGWRIYQDR